MNFASSRNRQEEKEMKRRRSEGLETSKGAEEPRVESRMDAANFVWELVSHDKPGWILSARETSEGF